MKAEKARARGPAMGFFIAGGSCLLISAFFAFVLAGYRFMALLFLLFALAAGLYGVFALLRRKKPAAAKVLRRTLTALICILAALLIVIEIPIVSAAGGDAEMEAGYLLVLGAGVDGRKASLSLQDRLEAAKAYLDRWPEARCILSGGKGPGEEITEAECMFQWLTDAGVDPERLILEEKAENTEENLAYAKALMPEGASLAIVSSEYHLYRAKLLAQRQGLTAYGVPARTRLPVLMLNGFFREAFAVAYLWLFG